MDINFKPWPLWLRLLLAMLAGASTVFAFAPYNVGIVLLLPLALLFFLWRMDASAKQAAWTGYVFGLGQMALGVSWVHVSIAQFGGVSGVLAIVMTIAFVMVVALYFALTGWLAKRLFVPGYDAIWVLLVVPAIWVLVEWLRGWFLSGFPWLSLGYSQIDLPLAGVASYLGVYGVSLLVMVSAGFIYLWRRWWAIVGLGLLWVTVFGLGQISWVEKAGEPFNASMVQPSIKQEHKWLPEMLQPTLELYQKMTALHAPESKLIIWPETAIPAFNVRVEDSLLKPLHEKFKAENRDLLIGVPVLESEDVYYNAMVNLGVSERDAYYKRHLVPFGEFLPLDFLLRPLLDFIQIPMSSFSAGDDADKPLLTLAGYQAGVDICYEDAFGAEIAQALPEAHFLVNASNDAWFGDSLAPHQHLQIARMRALETQRYMLRATNTGVSALIDEKGQLLKIAPLFKRVVLSGSVQPLKGLTPYVGLGNTGVIVLALLMLFIAYSIASSGARWAPGPR